MNTDLIVNYFGSPMNPDPSCRSMDMRTATVQNFIEKHFVCGILKSMGIEKGINPLDPQYKAYIDAHWHEYYQSVRAMRQADIWSIKDNGDVLYQATTANESLYMLSIIKCAVRMIKSGNGLTAGTLVESPRAVGYLNIVAGTGKRERDFFTIQLLYDKQTGIAYLSITQ